MNLEDLASILKRLTGIQNWTRLPVMTGDVGLKSCGWMVTVDRDSAIVCYVEESSVALSSVTVDMTFYCATSQIETMVRTMQAAVAATNHMLDLAEGC